MRGANRTNRAGASTNLLGRRCPEFLDPLLAHEDLVLQLFDPCATPRPILVQLVESRFPFEQRAFQLFDSGILVRFRDQVLRRFDRRGDQAVPIAAE